MLLHEVLVSPTTCGAAVARVTCSGQAFPPAIIDALTRSPIKTPYTRRGNPTYGNSSSTFGCMKYHLRAINCCPQFDEVCLQFTGEMLESGMTLVRIAKKIGSKDVLINIMGVT